MKEWQTIESAPKDKHILVWHNPLKDKFYKGNNQLTTYGSYVDTMEELSEGVYVAEWIEGYTEDESGEGYGPYTRYEDW